MGVSFTIYAATLFLTRPIIGKLAHKIGTSKVVLRGMILLMTALFLLVKAHSIYAFLAAVLYLVISSKGILPAKNKSILDSEAV